MNVRLAAADLVNERTRDVDDALSQCSIGDWLHRWSEQRQTDLRVPNKVEVDFAIVVSRPE